MPKLNEQLQKCKHPNSRKTKAMAKQAKKVAVRQKAKLGQQVKQNLVAEKFIWFRDHLLPDCVVCTSEQAEQLIDGYLSRFDDELEQISIKHSIGHRKNRQHANREDIIKMTINREREEYNTCGLEMPDILDSNQVDLLRKWNGELRFLQNFKFRRISKKYLETEKLKML